MSNIIDSPTATSGLQYFSSLTLWRALKFENLTIASGEIS
jgi:hypothetical protein